VKAVDRWLQRWRIAKAAAYVPVGARLLDIGCADGALFRQLEARVGEGVGIDTDLGGATSTSRFRLIAGSFPEALTGAGGDAGTFPFDVITLLAVLEHVPPERQRPLAAACARHLKAGGRLIVTTPSPLVDPILDLLIRLRVIHGMDTEGHYGFRPAATPGIFAPVGFELEEAARFQLGLNHLFVFRRP
jgi:2-polyprenyl-3-methyl-5-hydroxy-6-metoxy-1,4-benzoquinol methylase